MKSRLLRYEWHASHFAYIMRQCTAWDCNDIHLRNIISESKRSNKPSRVCGSQIIELSVIYYIYLVFLGASHFEKHAHKPTWFEAELLISSWFFDQRTGGWMSFITKTFLSRICKWALYLYPSRCVDDGSIYWLINEWIHCSRYGLMCA